jgi:hypothetical protein
LQGRILEVVLDPEPDEGVYYVVRVHTASKKDRALYRKEQGEDRRMTAKNRAKRRIPDFKNRQEMAEWFDPYDLADYRDAFTAVQARLAKNLSEGVRLRLDPEPLAHLRAQAAHQGIDPTTLAHM